MPGPDVRPLRGDVFLDWFAASVARNPDSTATVSEGTRLTYRELDQRANHLAHRLSRVAVAPEPRIALYLDRSNELVVAIIAAFKVGGAFVAIDPGAPKLRLQNMIDACRPSAIVTTSALSAELASEYAPSIVLLERDASDSDTSFPAVATAPSSLAYGIFTSGSTGAPKLVGIEHRNLATYVRSVSEALDLPVGARYAVVSTLAADLGYTMVFPSLALGGELHVVSRATASDSALFTRYISDERIDCLKIVPSHLSALVAASPRPERALPMKRLVCGGEASSAQWMRRLLESVPGAKFFNHYGPTETTVGVITNPFEPDRADDVDRVPLGKALHGSATYVLDENLAEVRPGAHGELYIGGEQVSRGYVGRPDLTAARFVPSPFGPPGARLYRTGDLVRTYADGALDFLGRIDDQVKIRGYRVEPGEIASLVRQHPDVLDVAVVARERAPGDRQLVGYVIPRLGAAATINGTPRHVLPNQLAVAHLHRHETDYIYEEVFQRQAYFRHGIHLRDGARVLDVGANIGMFSLFCTLAFKAPRILAFEPNPTIAALLEANLAAYAPESRALRCGVGQVAGDATFTFFSGYSLLSGFHTDAETEAGVVKSYVLNKGRAGDEGAEQFVKEADALLRSRFAEQQFAVTVRTLSEVIASEQIDHIDLLKINVEKAEVGVLAGLDRRNWQQIDQIVAEIDLDENVEPIERMLTDNGFDYIIDQDSLLTETALRYVYAVRRGSGLQLDRSDQGVRKLDVRQPARRMLSEESLLHMCTERLPEYMVPWAFVLLESFPISPNGKLERDKLPLPMERRPRRPVGETAPEAAEQHATLHRLSQLWQQLLSLDDIEPEDSFFSIGGHSLIATQLGGLIRETFGVELTLEHIFEFHTLEAMSLEIERAMQESEGRSG